MSDIEATEDRVPAVIGDTVTIRLPQNASTGYVWTLAAVGDGLTVEHDAVVPPAAAAPGAAGHHVVRVRAERAGSWRVELTRARAWEQAPAERRSVTVTVT